MTLIFHLVHVRWLIFYVNEDCHDLGWGHWKRGEVGHICIDEIWPNGV